MVSFTQILSRITGIQQQPIPGHLTQYPDASLDGEKLQLVVGLDFGTAFTKLVIGERRRAYAVPFPGVAGEANSYLLPGVLSVKEDGKVELGRVPDARHHTDLKMRILQGGTDDDTIVLAASFIALALQHARAWFLNTHASTYKQYQLDWYVNVGLPTEHYHDDSLVRFYRQLVGAAWLASTSEAALDLETVSDCFADSAGSISEDAIGTFPEFVAQISGYVRSSMRRSDLHLLLDVGAGTVDVAVFNVYERDGEDRFPIFSKSVSLKGVQFLHKHRLDSATVPAGQPVAFVEGASDEQVASSLGLGIAQLRRIDASFRQGVLKQIQSDIEAARSKYPLSRHWQDGVPFFLCGGGANVELYAGVADLMERENVPCRLTRLHLPLPERLEAPGSSEAAYDRLSVAYGLSFDPYDIGEIVRSNEIEEIRDDTADRNEPCPACNGTGGMMANSCSKCGGSGWLAH